jgi:acetolactate synthase-1/2/3 large subunit
VDVVEDVGQHGCGGDSFLPPVGRGGRLVALGIGAMGYSFGAGVGMAFARCRGPRPCRRTVVIAGDGAFYMRAIEIHTSRFDPSQLGAGPAAMSPGLTSVEVTDADEFSPAKRTALDVDGPSVVSVECAADEIPPVATFRRSSKAKNVVSQEIR